MRFLKILATSAAALVLSATLAAACGVTEDDCNRNAFGVEFRGNVVIQEPVEATICHGYFDLLNVGTYRGQSTRWWGPTMVYNNWYGDLPVSTQACKTYWVRPGTEFRVFASCVDRVISTGIIRGPGTYIMN